MLAGLHAHEGLNFLSKMTRSDTAVLIAAIPALIGFAILIITLSAIHAVEKPITKRTGIKGPVQRLLDFMEQAGVDEEEIYNQ